MARRKKTRPQTAKRKYTRRTRRATTRTSDGGYMTAVNANLAQARDRLMHERVTLDGRIGAIEALMTSVTSPTPISIATMGRRGRPVGRAGSLKAVIGNVLSGAGEMQVRDVTARVLRAGYKTKNKTLDKSVGIALAQMPTVRKVGRGVFRLR